MEKSLYVGYQYVFAIDLLTKQYSQAETLDVVISDFPTRQLAFYSGWEQDTTMIIVLK